MAAKANDLAQGDRRDHGVASEFFPGVHIAEMDLHDGESHAG